MTGINPEIPYQLYDEEEVVIYPPCLYQGVEIQEGIYFDMPDEVYHGAHAFSCSGAKDILISPMRFWNRNFNPRRKPEEETEAKEYGKAYDRYLLEPETFLDHYFIVPDDAPSRPGKRQINAKKPSFETTQAIKYWHDLLKEHDGKKIVKSEAVEDFKEAWEMMQYYPDIKDAFTGGYPQVSFFIRHNGIMFKCRVDYLTPPDIKDLKTYSNSMRKPIDKVTTDAITNEKYNFQHYLYTKIVNTARMKFKLGEIHTFGDVSEKFIDEFKKVKASKFFLVFQESAQPNEMRQIELVKAESDGGTKNVYYDNGRRMYEKSLGLYKSCIKKYGINKPWIPDITSYILSDEEIPSMMNQAF